MGRSFQRGVFLAKGTDESRVSMRRDRHKISKQRMAKRPEGYEIKPKRKRVSLKPIFH